MIYEAHALLQKHFATGWGYELDGTTKKPEGEYLTSVDWPNGKLSPKNTEDWVRFVLTETSGDWGISRENRSQREYGEKSWNNRRANFYT